MKTTIEKLIFPESIKTKLKMKVSQSNLKIEYISGHIIKFNKTNLSIMEPHKIITTNNKTTLVALLYEDEENEEANLADEGTGNPTEESDNFETEDESQADDKGTDS